MLVISNYSNFLSISLRLNPNSPKEEVVEKNLALPHDILSRSEIINVEKYTEKLKETLVELKINYKQVPCVFLVDPSKVNFRFIKNSKDIDEKEELGKVLQELGINESDYYFSGQKRTPLFSQFVCINKKSFDDILEVGAKLNLRITGIFSYLSLLSRLKNISEKSAFVSSYLGNAVVLFTRYGGIFFNKIYGQFTNIENSNKLMRLISEHKQSGSIDEVYSFNFETPEMSLSLGINEISISNSEKFQNPIHALADQVLRDENSDIFGSNFNFINLIVEEPKEAKSNILVKISLSALVLFLTLGVGGYYYFYPQQISQVLSSFTSTQEKAEPTPTEEVIKDFDVTKQPTAVEETNKNDPENTNKEGDSSVQIDGEAIDLDAPMTTKDIDKTKFRVQILNSTSTPGVAGRASELLRTSLGYKNVSVGNSNEKVQGTIARIKKSYEKYINAFSKEFLTLKDLKFEVVDDQKQSFDLIIIIGK